MPEKRTRKVYWIALGILAAILLVSFTYSDIVITTRHGINFWDILFKGRFLHFYEDNVLTSTGNRIYPAAPGTRCDYNILVYIVFGIWSFPLWLLEKASVDVMNSIPCMIWMKLLPVSAALLCAFLLGKVLRLVNVSEERIQGSRYLYLSSSLILTTVLITSRYDSLCTVFLILALWGYVKKDRRGFLFWSGIAFCFNYFSVLVFAPLLLLREKKILKIAGNLLLMLIPYGITTAPFLIYPARQGAGLASDLLPMLFSRANSPFHWFIVAYAAILVFAYKMEEREADFKTPVWLCCVSLASMFAFCTTYPYWQILICPYIAILAGLADRQEDHLNNLLETAAMAGLVLENMVYYYWCYIDGCMRPMLMSVLFPAQMANSHIISELWMSLRGRNLVVTMIHSVFVAGILIFAYMNYPGRKGSSEALEAELDGKETNMILFLRWAVNVVICCLPFLTLIK